MEGIRKAINEKTPNEGQWEGKECNMNNKT
jgi:hypothetical protein